MPGGFNRLLVAWFASVTGDGMRFAALPLLALTLSPSPIAVSAVAAATALPWLLIALPAGALVDRLDPASVIAVVNACRALAAVVLVGAVLTHSAGVAALCGVGFALTAGETFADSAGQSLLVRLVPGDRLEKANARFVSSENIGLDLIGPLAAGGLFVIAHWLPFAVAAAVFAGTAHWVRALRGQAGPPRRPGSTPVDLELRSAGAESMGVESVGGRPIGAAPIADAAVGAASEQRLSVRAGFRVIFADPQLRTLVITVAVMSAAIASAEGVLVLYSDSSLRLPAALYPTLLACYSIGLVLAAAAVARWGGRIRPEAMMVAAVAVIGVMLVVLGVFPSPVVAWWAFLVMGAGGGVWNVLSASKRQRRTPPSMVARVSSTFRAISWGALPLGTALGGLIGQTWSVPTVFVIAGLVILVLALVAGRLLTAAQESAEQQRFALESTHAVDVTGAAEPVRPRAP